MSNDKMLAMTTLVTAVVVGLAAPASADTLSFLLKGTLKVAGAALEIAGEAGKVAVGVSGEAGKVAVGATGKLLSDDDDDTPRVSRRTRESYADSTPRETEQADVREDSRGPSHKFASASDRNQVHDVRRQLEQRISQDAASGKITQQQARSLYTEIDDIVSRKLEAGPELTESGLLHAVDALERVENRLERYLVANISRRK